VREAFGESEALGKRKAFGESEAFRPKMIGVEKGQN
jgi:hypothetical protein